MITINYDFKDRRAEDLQQLNAMLASMRLQDLKLEDGKGYLSTTRDANGNLLECRYGLDSGRLVCTLSKDEAGYYYQIDTMAIEKGFDHLNAVDNWRQAHPDRIVRIVIQYEFNAAICFVIVHHQRV